MIKINRQCWQICKLTFVILLQLSPPTHSTELTERRCVFSAWRSKLIRIAILNTSTLGLPCHSARQCKQEENQSECTLQWHYWPLAAVKLEARGSVRQRQRKCCNSWHQVLLLPGPSSLNPMFRFGTVTLTMTEPISHQLTHTHTHRVTDTNTHSRQAKPEQWGQSCSLISCDSD